MKKRKLLLLDANVVIHLFELGLWAQAIARCDVHLSKIVVEQESQYYEDPNGAKHDIDLSDDVEAGRIQVFEESPSHLMAFTDSFYPSYFFHQGTLDELSGARMCDGEERPDRSCNPQGSASKDQTCSCRLLQPNLELRHGFMHRSAPALPLPITRA